MRLNTPRHGDDKIGEYNTIEAKNCIATVNAAAIQQLSAILGTDHRGR